GDTSLAAATPARAARKRPGALGAAAAPAAAMPVETPGAPPAGDPTPLAVRDVKVEPMGEGRRLVIELTRPPDDVRDFTLSEPPARVAAAEPEAKQPPPAADPEPAATPEPAPPPPAHVASLPHAPPPAQPVRREATFTGQRISLDFKDADIQNVLRVLADVSGLNIIATDDVKGKVTLHLNDVPWDQALDLVLRSNRLEKTQEGNVVRISTVSRLKEEREALRAAQDAERELEPLRVKYIRVNYAKADE